MVCDTSNGYPPSNFPSSSALVFMYFVGFRTNPHFVLHFGIIHLDHFTFYVRFTYSRSRGRSALMATRLQPGLPRILGSIFDRVKKFYLPYNVHTGSEAQYSGYKGLFPGTKWPRREAVHALPSTAEIKNILPIPHTF